MARGMLEPAAQAAACIPPTHLGMRLQAALQAHGVREGMERDGLLLLLSQQPRGLALLQLWPQVDIEYDGTQAQHPGGPPRGHWS